MKALAQLRVVRVVLAASAGLRALAWGVVVAYTLVLGAALIDLLVPVSLAARNAVIGVAMMTAVAVAGAMLWRDRGVLSLTRVALWIEERFPTLEYALVTAVETGNRAFVEDATPEQWSRAAWRRAIRALRTPVVVVAAATIVLVVLPGGAIARMRSPHSGDSLDRAGLGARSSANRLTPLVADVAPPAYSGQRPTTVDEPSDIRALVGSVITVRGRGDGQGIVAHAGPDTIAARQRGDRWSIALRVTTKPLALRLTDRTFQRVVAIEPVVDEIPTVVLVAPAHDSVLRTPTGRIGLIADATDDLGLVAAAFEYIVSSGEGETFQFRSGTFGATKPNGRRTSITSSISIDSIGLKPGDIVHLRAVARDANSVSGPGVGVSETRSIRIARRDEYDTVAVDAAGPAGEEKSVISQRMLIILAEALEKRRPALRRDTVVGESRRIASDQKKLRRAVGDIVFTRLGGDPSGEEHTDEESPTRAKTMAEMLARADSMTNRSTDPIDFEGGESPVVAVNKPLLEAYNAMWSAGTELEIGEPGRALPHMRRALAAIQRARSAERLYLRGSPTQPVIDINKSRLTGKDKGSSSARRPLTASDSAARARINRFSAVVELASRDARAAIDSLLVLRIDALGDEPAFATALSEAANAMRAGKSDAAMSALARARRALAGSPFVRDSLTRWGGGGPP